MTFVGKILVIVIMVFSLFFLALSSVVLTTSVNWKDEATKQKKRINELQGTEIPKYKGQLETAKKDLEKTRQDYKSQTDQLKSQITDLGEREKGLREEVTKARDELEKAQETAKLEAEEAEARRTEAENLRVQVAALQKQANDYKLQQTELNDRIRILDRDLAVAKANNKDLRERVGLLSGSLRQHGLPDDPAQIKGVQGSPPNVEGEVARVDPRGRTIELTIGSDDGLVPGHELYIFRIKPLPQYIGRIRIISADPDHSVATVVGRTYNGIKIKEGDIVANTLHPRGRG